MSKNNVATIGIVGLCLIVTGLIAPPATRADGLDKTVMTFNRPLEIPGLVLPAGKYLFEVGEPLGVRNVVRISNADGTKMFATVIVWDFRFEENPEDFIVMFDEAPASLREAVRSWFDPSGEHRGFSLSEETRYGGLERELAEIR